MDKAEQGKRQTTITHRFLAMHPYILKKAKFDDGKEEYCITMLFPKKVDLEKPAAGQKYSLWDICRNAAAAEWGDDEDDWPEDLEWPFRDGDKDKKKKDDENYNGHIFLKAKNKNRQPGLVDADKEDITDPEEIYSGCFCRAQVYAFAYNTSGNVGVSLIVHNVQKLDDGEHLGGSYQPAAEAFADADEEDDDTPPPKSKSSKSKARDVDEEDDDQPKKSKSSKSKSRDEEDDDDDLIEDEDDIPPPPKRKKK